MQPLAGNQKDDLQDQEKQHNESLSLIELVFVTTGVVISVIVFYFLNVNIWAV